MPTCLHAFTERRHQRGERRGARESKAGKVKMIECLEFEDQGLGFRAWEVMTAQGSGAKVED